MTARIYQWHQITHQKCPVNWRMLFAQILGSTVLCWYETQLFKTMCTIESWCVNYIIYINKESHSLLTVTINGTNHKCYWRSEWLTSSIIWRYQISPQMQCEEELFINVLHPMLILRFWFNAKEIKCFRTSKTQQVDSRAKPSLTFSIKYSSALWVKVFQPQFWEELK